ncbi:hypothetical protein GCM10022408_09530 [Hymenobacter fastidiosus]|uniref:Uncharacterized protein n=1 Tax=Hymenobacter fastidiosus TaxID=486264 RepID=A0ABP7RPP2_9BACT
MNGYSLLLGTLLAATFTGCEQEKVSPDGGYLVVGRYYGECIGESCIDIFKIDTVAERLYEDTADTYPSSERPYEGRYQLKSQPLYEQVRVLPQHVPAQLLTQPTGIVGQPDFADGGGYYVEVSAAGQRKFWLIDTQKNNIPVYLHAFVDELDAKIRSLQ